MLLATIITIIMLIIVIIVVTIPCVIHCVAVRLGGPLRSPHATFIDHLKIVVKIKHVCLLLVLCVV